MIDRLCTEMFHHSESETANVFGFAVSLLSSRLRADSHKTAKVDGPVINLCQGNWEQSLTEYFLKTITMFFLLAFPTSLLFFLAWYPVSKRICLVSVCHIWWYDSSISDQSKWWCPPQCLLAEVKEVFNILNIFWVLLLWLDSKIQRDHWFLGELNAPYGTCT